MTASLPEYRKAAIKRVLKAHDETLAEIQGPQDIQGRPRYRHEEVQAKHIAERIKQELEAEGKVLRVCSTVGAAMREAETFEESGLRPIVYHSCFRYVDRIQRHNQAVEAFQKSRAGPAFAVCTQVAEMGLDLANVTRLIAGLAPVPRAQTLRSWTQRPPITQNDRPCLRCSLAPVCLPEEKRLVTHTRWEPVRMFPAERDAKTLHVVTPGTRVSRAGDKLKITQPKGSSQTVPVRDVAGQVLRTPGELPVQAPLLGPRDPQDPRQVLPDLHGGQLDQG